MDKPWQCCCLTVTTPCLHCRHNAHRKCHRKINPVTSEPVK